MRGHIAKKGSRYYVVIYEGVDASTGKPKRRWHVAGDTLAEAEKLLRSWSSASTTATIGHRTRSPSATICCTAGCRRSRPGSSPPPQAFNERNIRLHINPNIGHILLQKLQPEDLDGLYAKLLSDGKRNGKDGGLSARSVRAVHTTIQSALSDAARKGTVGRNVADLSDPARRGALGPGHERVDQRRAPLLPGGNLRARPVPAVPARATTGMRRGELAGLTWRNVDLDAARLTVNRQILSVGYNIIESSLKSATSRRTIDLDPLTVAELRRHRRNQLEQRMATGRRSDDGYVFAKPDGSPVHPDYISQTFDAPPPSSTCPASASMICATPRQHPAATRRQRQGWSASA